MPRASVFGMNVLSGEAMTWVLDLDVHESGGLELSHKYSNGLQLSFQTPKCSWPSWKANGSLVEISGRRVGRRLPLRSGSWRR